VNQQTLIVEGGSIWRTLSILYFPREWLPQLRNGLTDPHGSNETKLVGRYR
jgi:hypothetical protein